MPHGPHTLPDAAWAKKFKGKLTDKITYFYAVIEHVGQNLGRLRKALQESGKAEDTILIFMTDNGGTAGVPFFNAGMRGRKTQVYEGGHRVPFSFTGRRAS